MSCIAMEEYDLLEDPKYRSYMTQVDRCLKAFESTTEWADLIAALSKLNRVLQAHMKYPIIPRRIVISKRLAQCMHPALPAGVHQKALETYDIIFKCMGTNRLAAELFIYSAGLFPLLSNAALNVRSLLLTVYETHFVPLGQRLRPGLNGFLSGVLPGLEEGSDHYQRTNALLEAVVEAVNPFVFYSALWECVAANATIRLPALTFVLAHCGNKRARGVGTAAMEEQPHLLGTDHDVMCRALCLALQDASALVQRAALDLLLVGFPLHQPQFVRADMVRLAASGLSALLRRDMSLNRRLFAWLLGLEVNPAHFPASHPIGQQQRRHNSEEEEAVTNPYFLLYTKELLVPALVTILEESCQEGTLDTKPYRIITTLLDKPEIGPLIIDEIILDIVRTLFHMSPPQDPTTSNQDLIKTANLLFSQLDTAYVWTLCANHFSKACSNTLPSPASGPATVLPVGSQRTNIPEICSLISFLLDIVSIETYVEASSEHLPRFFKAMVDTMSGAIGILSGSDLSLCLATTKKVLGRIQPAWNIWELNDSLQQRSAEKVPERNDSPDEAHEATESKPGSPVSMDKAEDVANSAIINTNIINNNVTNKSQVQRRKSAAVEAKSPHEELMEASSIAFTHLVVLLLQQRILLTPEAQWRSILARPRVELEKRDASLGSLLGSFIHAAPAAPSSSATTDEEQHANHPQLELRDLDVELVGAFGGACAGLLELSSMPTYRQPQPPSMEDEELPAWLQGLLLCSIVHSTATEAATLLQLTATSTLIELAGVLTSALAASSKRRVENVENILVSMDPLLKRHHLNYITRETDTVRLIAGSLWHKLGVVSPSHHLECVTLLHRLLELAPQAAQVENVVAESLHSSMQGTSVNVFRRFSQLWHLSRDLTTSKRSLDLCLMKMVSGLQSEKSAVRALCERWVEHCLTRGDTGRLLEPLLLSLLDPATARLSVLHASIKEEADPALVGSSDNTNRIFAISSVESNVVYHISCSRPEHRTTTRKVPSASHIGKPARTDAVLEALTSVNSSSSRFPYAKLSAWVNPFALVSSESEFNQDPSSTPEPVLVSSPASSPSLSSPTSSGYSTPVFVRRDGRNSLSVSPVRIAGLGASQVVAAILDELLDRVVSHHSPFLLNLEDLSFPSSADPGSTSDTERRNSASNAQPGDGVSEALVHPLHSHLLLYTRPIDSRAILHTLTALSGIIGVHPRLAVSGLATTGVASPSLARSVQLAQLMTRHKRSIFGKGFSSNLPPDSTASYRSSMLVEVVVTVCLYYLRSYYPSLPGLGRIEVLGNREVQLAAVSLLHRLTSQLISLVRDNGRPFALYIADLLSRTHLRKVILHSLLSGVHTFPPHTSTSTSTSASSCFSLDLLRFNDGEADSTTTAISVNTEAFQVELLKLVLSLVMLEEVVQVKRYEEGEKPKLPFIQSTLMKYNPEYPLPEQPMFLAAVLSALEQAHLRDLHHHWSGLVVACLPFLGSALTQVVTSVAAQIWRNLEQLAASCDRSAQLAASCDRSASAVLDPGDIVPSDYVLSQLESLGQILSYCLIEGGQAQGGVSATPTPLVSGQPQPSIVANLVHVFGGSASISRQPASQEQLLTARRSLLSMTPRLIAALSTLWAAISHPQKSSWLVGSSKAVKSMVLELLSPLATLHPAHFLAAVGVAWAEEAEQLRSVLVELTASLRMFPTSTLIATLRQVVKSPPAIAGGGPASLDVSCLQFFSCYLAASPAGQLSECWPCLKDLLKDCLSLKPPSVLLALSVLHQYVVRVGGQGLDRKEARDLQEINARLMEAVAAIAGSRLEAATWLRGTRTVRAEADSAASGGDEAVRAMNLLGELAATLLDIIYQSEEKERVLPLLGSLMGNVVPYLRHHAASGSEMLCAGSRLLASLSEYPYTRKAWRREAMDLLLDPAFFQMDHETLRFWRTTTDNLMTHDKTTFKELLTRIASLGQSNISIFSSKELEQEQRALLLKRLAFVIFCSDVDQYQKQMPDITDRLSECLRTVPVFPGVQAAVFLCFRVILLRMSAVHVTFLWPVIITEMVQVFSYIEQQLIADSEEFSHHLRRVGSLDTSWVAAAANAAGQGLGLQAQGSPAWLGVYLAVCKLLDQAAALPASFLPQFQMYRWAFVREGAPPSPPAENGLGQTPTHWQQQDFVPHIARIAKLLEAKVGRPIPARPIAAGEPLLTMRTIDSLIALGPWFSTLSVSLTRQQTKSLHSNSARQRSPVAILERIIELDFLEPMT